MLCPSSVPFDVTDVESDSPFLSERFGIWEEKDSERLHFSSNPSY